MERHASWRAYSVSIISRLGVGVPAAVMPGISDAIECGAAQKPLCSDYDAEFAEHEMAFALQYGRCRFRVFDALPR